MHTLPPHLNDALRDELAPGEKLLWAAQPLPGGFARSMIPLSLFAVPFLGFAIFWTVMASKGASAVNGAPGGPGAAAWAFPLFGIPFILVGACMLLSPFYGVIKAGRTVYAITDQGALLIEGSFFGARTVTRYPPSRLENITRRERGDGSGDLIFAHELYERPKNRGLATRPIGFLSIPTVRDAERVLREVIESAADHQMR
ncbi:MAG TPA: hypothetical protein VD997_16575 [Phycisphaerales bacterium]|nr:hypothetical protein [Phycisphaerales bacterium]